MLDHVEQLLGELGGEVEGEDGDPGLEEDYEPCSDDDEDDDDDAAMEHWPHPVASTLWFHFSASFQFKNSSALSKVPFLLVRLSHLFIKDEIWIQVRCTKRIQLKASGYSVSFSKLFNVFGAYLSNASPNILDRCWWKKFVLDLYFSPAAKAKHLWMLLPHAHTRFLQANIHNACIYTHKDAQRQHINCFSSSLIEQQQQQLHCFPRLSEIYHQDVCIIRELSSRKQTLPSLHGTVLIVYVQCLKCYAFQFILFWIVFLFC